MQRHLWHVPETNLSTRVAGELDAHAAAHWNTFYQQNKTKFFKDRHYLEREFPELGASDCTILEVGCGVGNSAFPLLELNQSSRIYACDFAPAAVELVKAHQQYSTGRMHAFVADITCDDLRAEVPANTVDICTMVFVLSAITPAKMPAAVANVARVLKPGQGRVVVRDYAEGDLAQQRLSGPKRKQRLAHNFYVRSDGTQAYYFSKDSLVKLFQDAGFRCEEYKVHERQIENRRQEVTMHRRWVQAAFTYLPNKPNTGRPTSTVSAEPTLTAQANAATSQATADRHTRQGATSPLGCTAQPAMLSDHQQLPGPLGRAVTGTPSLPHATVSAAPTQPTDLHHQQCFSAALAPESKHRCSQAAAGEGQQPLSSPDSLQAVASAQQARGSAEPQHLSGVASRQLPTVPGQASRQQHQGQGKTVAADSTARPVPEQKGQCGAAVATVQRQEWEEGGPEPEEGLLTGSLFDEDGFEEVVEDVEIEEGKLVARVVSVSRQHRHTLEHTGLMRWESCLPLARLLLALPSLTQGKKVLEVGCGVNPLCCLAALRHCHRYVATDGSLQALQGLARNLDLNCRSVVMERARTQALTWGNQEQQAVLAAQFSSFDTIIGADVVYAPEAVSGLFATCSALMTCSIHARLILCHIVRRVSEGSIIAAAAASGLVVAQPAQATLSAIDSAGGNGPFRFMEFFKAS